MQVVLIQFEQLNQSKEMNINRMCSLIERISNADLIVLPEIWASGYFNFAKYTEEAETLEGPLTKLFCNLAIQKNSWLMMGSFIENLDGAFYNTSVLINPKGKIAGVYRKIHLFGFQSEEVKILNKGNDITTVSTTWGAIGLATCYDLRFPELFRKMNEKGATIFLVTSAWPLARLEAWQLFCRARAHENLSWLIACNGAGTNQNVKLAGHSMIVDPMGHVLQQGDQKESIIQVNLNIDKGLDIRKSFPALQDRQIY